MTGEPQANLLSTRSILSFQQRFIRSPGEHGHILFQEVKRENALSLRQRSPGKLGMTENARKLSS